MGEIIAGIVILLIFLVFAAYAILVHHRGESDM